MTTLHTGLSLPWSIAYVDAHEAIYVSSGSAIQCVTAPCNVSLLSALLTHRRHDVISYVRTADGSTSVLAGSPTGTVGRLDGVGTAAQFNDVLGLAWDERRSVLYVSDLYNCSIRVVDLATAVVSTLAGVGTCGYADGNGLAALLNQPLGISYDLLADLIYVADVRVFRCCCCCGGDLSACSRVCVGCL